MRPKNVWSSWSSYSPQGPQFYWNPQKNHVHICICNPCVMPYILIQYYKYILVVVLFPAAAGLQIVTLATSSFSRKKIGDFFILQPLYTYYYIYVMFCYSMYVCRRTLFSEERENQFQLVSKQLSSRMANVHEM